MLYARQSAWLNAAPRPAGGGTDHASRMSKLIKAGGRPAYPPLTAGQHLIDHLMQAGPAMPGAMGQVPLSAQELTAWANGTASDLSPWEFATLLDMSHAWCQEYQAAEAPGAKPPYADPASIKHLRDSDLQQQLDIFLS